MRKFTFFFFFALFIYFESSACECIILPESLQDHSKRYDYIFFAEVESLVDNQVAAYYKSGGYHPKLRVLEVFKGKVKKKMAGEHLLMDNDMSIDAEYFQPGQLMLIFGSEGQKGGIATSSCASNWIFNSQEDFNLKKKEIQKATRRKFLEISIG